MNLKLIKVSTRSEEADETLELERKYFSLLGAGYQIDICLENEQPQLQDNFRHCCHGVTRHLSLDELAHTKVSPLRQISLEEIRSSQKELLRVQPVAPKDR